MAVVEWWKRKFSKSATSLSLYKSGISKANLHDHQGAIDDYCAAMEMPDITAELRAMVLYNRALVYAAARKPEQAIEDLNALLSMSNIQSQIKTAAEQKLGRIEKRSGKK